jgi:hypothetical protein
MNEAEWLTATDPCAMLEILRGRTGERKLRLFAVACCRRIWDLLLDARSQPIVEMAERFADSQVTLQQLLQAKRGTDESPVAGVVAFGLARHAVDLVSSPHCESLIWVAQACRDAVAARTAAHCRRRGVRPQERQAATKKAALDERQHQSELIRDLFVNPFRPQLLLGGEILTRNEKQVRCLATVIYESRTFGRLPILADALEDAGCTDADLLGHLRGPGPHVRGCWALDLVLAKE